jgi:Zn-dependent peptidase ImmA (M78 family)
MSAREFTLFHELGHLMLRQPGICQPDETAQERQSGTDVEVFCNAIAAGALMPMDALLNSDEVANYRERRTSLEEAVAYLVARFSVGRYVVLRRLLTARLVSSSDYQRLTKRWEAARQTEPHRQRSTYGPPPHVKTLSELGPRFVGRVLTAHERGQITDSDLADYLSLRLKHIDRLQTLLVPTAASA